jgi:hypothetical protein
MRCLRAVGAVLRTIAGLARQQGSQFDFSRVGVSATRLLFGQHQFGAWHGENCPHCSERKMAAAMEFGQA